MAASLFILAPVFTPVGPTADAQLFKRDRDKPSIFRRIFRRDEADKPDDSGESSTRRSSRQSSRAASTPKIKKVQAVKDENAKLVLVVGDFLAGSLARGLVAAFEEESGVKIVNKTQPASGVVRDEVYAWPGALRTELASGQYAAVVFLVGTNDRQGFRSTSPRIDLQSEEWLAEYTRRTVDLSQILTSTNVTPIWVGVPPVRPKKLNSHGINVSTVIRQQAAKKNIVYIDLFDAFTDEAGNYVRKGPDIAGQNRTLRTKDGVNFTRAGRRKLAFYVEQHLRRMLLNSGQSLAAAGAVNSAIGVDSRVDVGPVLSLADASDYPGDVLAGDKPLTEYTDANSPEYRRLIAGLALPLQPGRVDDFRLTRSGVSELRLQTGDQFVPFNNREATARLDQ